MPWLLQGAANGEVPVGAVLVRDSNILVRAHNLVEQHGDPTAHAEMVVIRQVRTPFGLTQTDAEDVIELSAAIATGTHAPKGYSLLPDTYMRNCLCDLEFSHVCARVVRWYLLVDQKAMSPGMDSSVHRLTPSPTCIAGGCPRSGQVGPAGGHPVCHPGALCNVRWSHTHQPRGDCGLWGQEHSAGG